MSTPPSGQVKVFSLVLSDRETAGIQPATRHSDPGRQKNSCVRPASADGYCSRRASKRRSRSVNRMNRALGRIFGGALFTSKLMFRPSRTVEIGQCGPFGAIAVVGPGMGVSQNGNPERNWCGNQGIRNSFCGSIMAPTVIFATTICVFGTGMERRTIAGSLGDAAMCRRANTRPWRSQTRTDRSTPRRKALPFRRNSSRALRWNTVG